MRKVFILLLVAGVLIGTVASIEGVAGDAASEPTDFPDELFGDCSKDTDPSNGEGGTGGGSPVPG